MLLLYTLQALRIMPKVEEFSYLLIPAVNSQRTQSCCVISNLHQHPRHSSIFSSHHQLS